MGVRPWGEHKLPNLARRKPVNRVRIWRERSLLASSAVLSIVLYCLWAAIVGNIIRGPRP